MVPNLTTEIAISMACSVNGFIADENGCEDFLSNENWQDLLRSMSDEYDVMIWGRKTLDAVMGWNDEYMKDVYDFNKIILGSQKSIAKAKIPNIFFCNSIDEVVKLCAKNNWRKILVSGGAATNLEFLKSGLVNKFMLNLNPVIISRGRPIFDNKDEILQKLSLSKVDRKSSGIVTLIYDFVKK